MAEPDNAPSNPFENLRGFFFANDLSDPRVNQQLRQRIALSMMSQKKGYPKNIGEGLTAIGDALGDRGVAQMLAQQDIAAQNAATKLGAAPYAAAAPATAAPAAAADASPAASPAPDTTSYAADTPDQPAVRAINEAITPAGGGSLANAPPDQGGYNAIDAQAGFPANRLTPGYMQDAIARQVKNPDMQAYFGSLVAAEAPNGPRDTSSTGAAGPYQFTRGTGQQYGLVGPGGDQRQNLDASTAAAMKLTQDNADIFAKVNGRPPTMAELALMHQQGGGTGARMVAGTGNASPANLAVNNVSPQAGPQQAVNAIKGFYGMPDRPIDPRATVANALLRQQPSAQAVPQPNPMQPGVATPPPLAAGLDPGGPSADQRLALAAPAPAAPASMVTATDIKPAPPVPSQMQVAQAAPQPTAIPGYVPPAPGPVPGAPIAQMTPREIYLNRLMAANQGNPYAAMSPAAMELKQLQGERAIRQNEANERFKAAITQQSEQAKMRQEALMTQATRQQETVREGAQPMPAGQDPRLGTPASPQRTGPALPPVPPGTSLKTWSDQQAPEITKAIAGYEKAKPQFEESIRQIREARDHPGKAWGIGPLGAAAQSIPGTPAYDFGTRLGQLTSKAFLKGYADIKGAGSISNIEGTKTQDAQARLANAQSPKSFEAALNDFENSFRQDLETMQRKLNLPVTAWQLNQNAPVAPDIGQRGPNKKTGKMEEYIGGNPAVDSSYRSLE
jgi:hypothetical protein